MTLGEPIFGQLSLAAVLCLSLAHFLWQAVLIVTAALLAGAVLRRFSSQAQYAVHMLGLLLLPVAFIGTLAWYGWQNVAAPTTVIAIEQAVAADDLTATPLFLLAADQTEAAASPVNSESLRTSLPMALASRLERYAPLLAGAYLIAVALMSLRLVIGLCGAQRLVRQSAAIDDEKLLATLARQCKRLGLRTIPAVAWCRDVAVPTVIGVVRPTILLPLSALSGMTAEEIETILVHELVHIRRYDHLCLLAQRAIEAVFFFHPAVWLLSRRASDVREHCCDDRVIALGAERHVYVQSLLRAAELSLGMHDLKQSSALAVALSAVDNPSRLRQRVLRLVGQPLPARVRLRTPAIVALVALAAALVATPLTLESLAQTGASETKSPETKAADSAAQQAQAENARIQTIKLGGELKAAEQAAADAQARVQVLDTYPVEELAAIVAANEQGHSVSELVLAHLKRDDASCMKCHQAIHSHPSWRLHLTSEPTPPHDMRGVDALSSLRERYGEQFLISLEGSTEGSIWGTDVYTYDSRVEKAAVHAGLVKPGEKAELLLTVLKSPPRHTGSTRNGVQSQDYGSFSSSYMLSKPAEKEKSKLGLQTIRFRETKSFHGYALYDKTSAAPTNAVPFRQKFGRQFDVEIVGATEGHPVWGTDVYTDDSAFAGAAVHAGLVKPGERAIVTVTIVESPEQHVASERNGVKSGTWGSYPSSYILTKKSSAATAPAKPPAPENAKGFRGKLGRRFDVEVVGRLDGYVWGTDVYTDDSHIATAAVHAGLVKPDERAIVTLTIVESPEAHRGSARNGVTSRPFGSYPSSYILQRKSEESPNATIQLNWEKSGASGYLELLPQITPAPPVAPVAPMAPAPADNGSLPPTVAADAFASSANDLSGRVDVGPPLLELPAPANTGPVALGVELTPPVGPQPPPVSVDLSFGSIELDAPKFLSRVMLAEGSVPAATRGQFGERITLEVVGRDSGRIWGSGVYTDDSDIATAAVHSGLVKPGEKASVVVTIVKSPGEYKASTKNGVTSNSYGAYPSAFIVQKAEE